MIELIKFELKKIFSNKLVFITAAILAISILGISTVNMIKTKNKFGTREEIQGIVGSYINGNYSNEEIDEIIDKIREKYMNGEALSKDEEVLLECNNCYSIADENRRHKNIEKIDSEINVLKEDNKEDTFEYNNLLKKKEMIEALPEGESIFCGDWYGIFNFKLEGTMKIILLTIGIAGILSKEYSNRVTYINLSTKNGKTKLNIAKVIAAFIYATSVFIFITILFWVKTCYLGLPNGDKPISYIMDSVYNISINQYFLYTLALSYFGTLIVAMFIVLLSLITKNILVEFGLPIVLLFITSNFDFPSFTRYFNISKLFTAKELLVGYEGLNVFGNVVLYPYVITFAGVIVSVVMLLLYKRFGKRQTIV